MIKVWDIRAGYVTHTFHGHSGVISALHLFQSTAVGADQTRNGKKQKKRQSEHIDSEMIDSDPASTAGLHLASGGGDAKIRVWDLNKSKSVASLDAHVSVVRSLDFAAETQNLLSASRDKTVIVWDVRTWQIAATVPVLEGVESAGFVNNGKHFFTGGEHGRVRIWTVNGQETTQEQDIGLETEAIVDILLMHSPSALLSVHADQMLIVNSLESLFTSLKTTIPTLPITRRIYGTHDEVIDLAYIGKECSVMALATNSEDIRLVNVQESSKLPFGSDVDLLRGHEDIIITVDTDWSGHWLATGAKDNTARLWRLDPVNKSFACYATFTGHAESISAVALPKARPVFGSKAFEDPLHAPPAFMITGSQDKTIKKWEVSPTSKKGVRAAYTRKAHDKDINAIDVSPSGQDVMFASASQDRTVKIWDLESGEPIGVLRGHKRGVWSVAFAPAGTSSISGQDGQTSGSRGMVLTGSGDKTVRIWSLNDYSCLRTFEGHTNSVLKVLWIPTPSSRQKKRNVRGVQVASAAGDGLVKVWNVQEDECAATLDNHTDRVWALVAKPLFDVTNDEGEDTMDVDDNDDDEGEGEEEATRNPTTQVDLVSGSADSTITFWRDTTYKTAQVAATRVTERVEQDQQLQNHIRSNNYREATVLALQLNHPKRLLDLFTRVVMSQSVPHQTQRSNPDADATSLTGSTEVDHVLAHELSDAQLWKLLIRIRDWNTNARSSRVAQRILFALFRLHPKDKFIELDKSRRKAVYEAATAAAEAQADADADDAAPRPAPQQKMENVRELIDGLKAYTEKHVARMDKLAEQRHVLAWTLQMMDETAAEPVTMALSANV